jgi:hypothetical protein
MFELYPIQYQCHLNSKSSASASLNYAILHAGEPAIALESKRVGTLTKDDRGQVESYFNACSLTVKLGNPHGWLDIRTICRFR